MSAAGTNVSSQMFAPFANGFINDSLLQPVPHLNQPPLQCPEIPILFPVLQQLHWLPVRQFKLAVLVYKALSNLAPLYLSDDCQLVATTGRC